jgi:hypothetical protein
MHVGKKSTLNKKTKNEIHRPQGRASVCGGTFASIQTVCHHVQNYVTKKVQAQWSRELKLSFIVEGAKHSRQQGCKAERCSTGKIFKKDKRRTKNFNYEYLRHDAFEVTKKKIESSKLCIYYLWTVWNFCI